MKHTLPVFAAIVLLLSACDTATTDTTPDLAEPPLAAVSPFPAPVPGTACPRTITIDADTMVTDVMRLRAGDTLRFENHARLMFAEGGAADFQGSPAPTWSWDGENPETITTNLSRDVVIEGEGDIMFHEGSGASAIRFVEIDLQPLPELDHYPLHWHFAGEGARGTLVEGVVVKNSTNRAFVPHGSHGITFLDNIASNIAGDALWWNTPAHRSDASNNSNDITIDRMLADNITNLPGDDRGFRLSAYHLSAGARNAIRNSVARGIQPSHPKTCSGFHWPEGKRQQPWNWEVENIATFDSACFGVFWWQNNDQAHTPTGLVMPDGVGHGAYQNSVAYSNLTTSELAVWAVGWSVSDSNIGTIKTLRSRFEGTVTFTNVTASSVVLRDAEDGGTTPKHLVFEGTNLACTDIVVENKVPASTVTINGEVCPL